MSDKDLFRTAALRALESGELSEEETLKLVEDVVFEDSAARDREDLVETEALIRRVYGRMRGVLGELSYILDERGVNEIMVNGPGHVFVERFGHMERVEDSFADVQELENVIRRIAASVHREINELNPILDARLPDGSRVNAVMKNVAIGGPSLTIRKFGDNRILLEDMISSGSISEECAEDLKDLVTAGYNIFVSGGTSSGKTTFLNALSEFIPQGERVVVIEDSLELKLDEIENIVRLECRTANSAGRGAVTMNDLIRASLRMRPDRLIVGEVRGGEVSSMLQALNTGHSGMSTGHGNSVKGMLRRLEAMYLSGADIPIDAIRMQIVEAIDIMVHMERLKDGSRRVVEVREITGYKDGSYELNTLYELSHDMKLTYTGNKLKDEIKLRLRGIENERLCGSRADN
ncbi:MAG: CpaF family protein [Eubacterium sp.]|jgi:pilus assembly protein CpaF